MIITAEYKDVRGPVEFRCYPRTQQGVQEMIRKIFKLYHWEMREVIFTAYASQDLSSVDEWKMLFRLFFIDLQVDRSKRGPEYSEDVINYYYDDDTEIDGSDWPDCDDEDFPKPDERKQDTDIRITAGNPDELKIKST